MRLAESSKFRTFFTYQTLIYVVVFSISAYTLYRFVLSSEVGRLKVVIFQYNSQKAMIKAEEEKARNINTLSIVAQELENELSEMQRRVFNEDSILEFMRLLPKLSTQTGNKLISIVPSEKIEPSIPKKESTNSQDKDNKNTNNKQDVPIQQNTIPYTLKPVEVIIEGKYGNIISFFDQIEKLRKYITISSFSLSNTQEDLSVVSARFVLNLIQMNIKIEPPKNKIPTTYLMAKQTQPTVDQQKSASKTNIIQVAKNDQPIINQNSINLTSTQTLKQTQNIEKQTKVIPKMLPNQIQTVKKEVQPEVKSTTKQITKTPQITKKDTKPVNSIVPSEITKVPENVSKKIHYAVRVGVFISEKNASNLVSLLNSKNYEAWIDVGKLSDKTAYYVYAGKFDNKNEAKALGRNIRKNLPSINYYFIVKNFISIEPYKVQSSKIIE